MVFVPLAKQYIYIDDNHKRRVASVGNKASGCHVLSHAAAALVQGGALRSLPSLIPINKLY